MLLVSRERISLEIVDGYATFVPGQTFLHGNISTFLDFQFPCTASYNGSEGDQPQVTISYTWCRKNCGGWSIKTENAPISQWAEPLIAFILPTIVFCFAIPLRQKIALPRGLFPSSKALSFPGNLALFYQVPISSAFMTIDALLWLAVTIVLAGPMMLSGTLEILLDSRLLSFLEVHTNDHYLSAENRTRHSWPS